MEEKEPNIIKILKNEERLGLLQNKVQKYYNEPRDSNVIFEDHDDSSLNFVQDDIIEKDCDTTFFDNINENELSSDKEEIKKKYLELIKKYNELIQKFRESKEKMKSLTEYFGIISDTTIALGEKDLFSNVSDIIFQISPTGKITYINSAIEKILGYPPKDIIGSNFSKLISENDWKKVRKTFFSRFGNKNRMDEEINSFETFIYHKDGRCIPVEINGKLININVEVMGRSNQVRLQGSIRDITERKLAEEEKLKNAKRLEEMNKKLYSTNQELNVAQMELRLLNQDLENKVVERTAEIEKLLKHKDEFIGQLGHDLKSPLTPLVGLLPTIQEEEKDPNLKELLKVVNRNVNYMRDLVVKTLKLERLNSPNLILNFEAANLFEIIEKMINNKEYILKEKSLNISNKINKNFIVKIDKLEFYELIDNIITNAIKFTPKNGSIIFDALKNKDLMKISVIDNGIGLTSNQIEHIFEEFYKVDPSRHDLESSGLGLTICKRIVEKHGGKIWVESPGLGKGSTFYFTIPIN